MRNLTPIERRFVWRTKSPRMRLALLCWTLGLRRVAARLAKVD